MLSWLGQALAESVIWDVWSYYLFVTMDFHYVAIVVSRILLQCSIILYIISYLYLIYCILYDVSWLMVLSWPSQLPTMRSLIVRWRISAVNCSVATRTWPTSVCTWKNTSGVMLSWRRNSASEFYASPHRLRFWLLAHTNSASSSSLTSIVMYTVVDCRWPSSFGRRCQCLEWECEGMWK